MFAVLYLPLTPTSLNLSKFSISTQINPLPFSLMSTFESMSHNLISSLLMDVKLFLITLFVIIVDSHTVVRNGTERFPLSRFP